MRFLNGVSEWITCFLNGVSEWAHSVSECGTRMPHPNRTRSFGMDSFSRRGPRPTGGQATKLGSATIVKLRVQTFFLPSKLSTLRGFRPAKT
jgi:hypothetical protein